MIRVIYILIFVLFGSTLHALSESETKGLFKEGNEAYQAEDWDLAIEKYKAIEIDFDSPALFGNLGNAYFKKGEIAEAIYHFSRSLKLDPNQDDIVFNLEKAKEKTVDKLELQNTDGLGKWWNKNMAMIGVDRLANFSILMAFLMLLAFALFLYSRSRGLKRLGFYIGIASLILAIVFLISSIRTKTNILEMNQGIVMAPKLDVKTAPTESAGDAFILHEGTEVILLGDEEGWYKISLGDDRIGWARMSSVRGY